MILLIDNYDSFSYNLYQLIGEITPDVKVIRNDELRTDEIRALRPEKVILSPGPGRPENAGVTLTIAKTLARSVPTLGVCLGHQAICAAYGGEITYARELMHGKQSEIQLDTECMLFDGIPERIKAARYHSLAVDSRSVPDCLKITAVSDDGEIMAVQHKDYPIFGVQFHPESIMTEYGRQMLLNFVKGDF